MSCYTMISRKTLETNSGHQQKGVISNENESIVEITEFHSDHFTKKIS